VSIAALTTGIFSEISNITIEKNKEYREGSPEQLALQARTEFLNQLEFNPTK